tara:strand:+ start:1020 stop:1160 length:141 start_codon:yes stop_codon:yes gene_type:complete
MGMSDGTSVKKPGLWLMVGVAWSVIMTSCYRAVSMKQSNHKGSEEK